MTRPHLGESYPHQYSVDLILDQYSQSTNLFSNYCRYCQARSKSKYWKIRESFKTNLNAHHYKEDGHQKVETGFDQLLQSVSLREILENGLLQGQARRRKLPRLEPGGQISQVGQSEAKYQEDVNITPLVFRS